MKFLIAVSLGLVSPTVAANCSDARQDFRGPMFHQRRHGRWCDPVELAGERLDFDHDEHYLTTDEFLTV